MRTELESLDTKEVMAPQIKISDSLLNSSTGKIKALFENATGTG